MIMLPSIDLSHILLSVRHLAVVTTVYSGAHETAHTAAVLLPASVVSFYHGSRS